MEDVWPGLVVGQETVSQRVKLLRDALGDDSRMPRYIGRLRGRGYYLVPTAVALGDEVAGASPPVPAVEPIAHKPEPSPDAVASADAWALTSSTGLSDRPFSASPRRMSKCDELAAPRVGAGHGTPRCGLTH